MEANPAFASINLKLILEEIRRDGFAVAPNKIHEANRLLEENKRATEPDKLFHKE